MALAPNRREIPRMARACAADRAVVVAVVGVCIGAGRGAAPDRRRRRARSAPANRRPRRRARPGDDGARRHDRIRVVESVRAGAHAGDHAPRFTTRRALAAQRTRLRSSRTRACSARLAFQRACGTSARRQRRRSGTEGGTILPRSLIYAATYAAALDRLNVGLSYKLVQWRVDCTGPCTGETGIMASDERAGRRRAVLARSDSSGDGRGERPKRGTSRCR